MCTLKIGSGQSHQQKSFYTQIQGIVLNNYGEPSTFHVQTPLQLGIQSQPTPPQTKHQQQPSPPSSPSLH